MSNIGPMREQLDVQQVSIGTLQGQLASAKEELAIITVERDHLEEKLKNATRMEVECPEGGDYQVALQKKVLIKQINIKRLSQIQNALSYLKTYDIFAFFCCVPTEVLFSFIELSKNMY